MRLLIVLIFMSASFIGFGEDKYAQKAKGWKAWEHLEKTILANKEKESIALCSGRMKEGFVRFGMPSIIVEVGGMKPVFIREFTNVKGNQLYLTVNVQGELRTLMFTKKGTTWLFDEQNNEEYKNPKDTGDELTTIQVSNKLGYISAKVHSSLSSREDKNIVSPEKFGIDPEKMKYFDPQTQKSRKIFLIQGVKLKKSADYLLAITEGKINGKHYGINENDSVVELDEATFKKHSHLPGIAKPKQQQAYTKQESEELASLLMLLGAEGFRDRKKAKKAFLKWGRQALPFLRQNKENSDYEVKISVVELIKEITENSIVRPKL